MKLLITGCSGFIGRNLVRSIITPYVGMVNSRLSVDNNNVFSGDICEIANIVSMLENIDCVIHLAGLAHTNKPDYDKFYMTNVKGSELLAKEAASAGVKTFIFASSSHIPEAENDISKNKLPKLVLSKYQAELKLLEVGRLTGMKVVILRLPMVYGVDCPGSFSVMKKLAVNLKVTPFLLLDRQINMLSVKNLVDALIVCLESQKTLNGGVYYVFDEKPMTISQILTSLASIDNKSIYHLPVPPLILKWLLLITGKRNLINVLFENSSNNRKCLKDYIDWQPRFDIRTTFEDSKNVN